LRPAEFETVELYPWYEAEDYQRAWKEGVEQADDENRANQRST